MGRVPLLLPYARIPCVTKRVRADTMAGKEVAIMSDIAKNIKKLRQKKKLTQEELAEKLYVTRQAVSNWETGKNQPDIETLKSMAEVLGTDINELLYGPAPDENQRQKIVIATILCVLTVVAWLFYFPLLEWAKIRKGAYFEVIWSFLCGLGLKPLAFLLTGAAISAVLAVWTNIPPIKEIGRAHV